MSDLRERLIAAKLVGPLAAGDFHSNLGAAEVAVGEVAAWLRGEADNAEPNCEAAEWIRGLADAIDPQPT